MKAILEFDLNDEFDNLEHKRAISATDAYLVIYSIQEHLRNKLKHGYLPDDVQSTLEEVSEELHGFINKYNVDMNNLE